MEDACGVDVGRADPRAAPAALLRRVDREPRAAHLPAARARLPRLRERDRRWPRTTGARRARAAPEEGRQRRDDASSAGARSIRSTCGSAASTGRRRSRSCAARRRARAGARGRARDGPLAPGSTSPSSSRTTSSSRSTPTTTRSRRPARVEPRPRHRGLRSTSTLRRGARRVLERAPLAAIGRRPLPRRAARALCALPTACSPLAPRRRRRPGSSADVRNPFKSIVVRAVELVYAADEALRLIAEYEPPGRPPSRSSPRRRRPRLQRGAARDLLSPLRARRRRHDPRREDRAADVAEPDADRGRPARRRRALLDLPTTSCRCAASRRSATTTPASPARPTS